MPLYVGLDVSQKTTAICVVDQQGRRHWRGTCATEPVAIASLVRWHAGADAEVGLETGSMTPWLVHGLRSAGLTIVCLDARRVRPRCRCGSTRRSERRQGLGPGDADRLVSGSPRQVSGLPPSPLSSWRKGSTCRHENAPH
ncbi:MAG: transposase [Caulobacteraceae bacterium]|nr:transposase [Caulobacteraceae bacterium]